MTAIPCDDPHMQEHDPLSRDRILSTGRLTLTTWVAGDVAELHKLHSDARAMKHMSMGAQRQESVTRRRLQSWQIEYQLRG